MTFKKYLENYPPEYAAFFRQATQRETTIVCDSEKQAHVLRDDLYGYRQVYCLKHLDSETCKSMQNVIMEVHNNELKGLPMIPEE